MWKILPILILLIGANLVNGASQVPCFFIFGDSLSDAGTNNGLITLAKANYPPYGVDFPGGSTGRFTNGRTTVDFISQYLGFQSFIKPYSSQIGQDLLRGANFASGVAGILPRTSYHVGDRIWMDRQLDNFGLAISKLQTLVQGPVSDYLNKCFYSVNIGSNDYLFNYFYSPLLYNTKKKYTPEQFAALLVNDYYKGQLERLYNSGARKVAVFGLGPIGCTPASRAMNLAITTPCVEEMNVAAQLFNTKLVSLVDDLNTRLSGAKFTFIDVFAMQLPPGANINSPCCLVTPTFLCTPFLPPCANRNSHVFMDGYHPTEVVFESVATNAFNTPNPSYVHPVDINTLINSP